MRCAFRSLISAIAIIMGANLTGPSFAEDMSFLSESGAEVIELPKGLAEVSGLALASDKTVYAHNDEYGIIYEVEVETGKVSSIFAIGDPTLSSDFEGIAAHADRIYLINSDGILYEALIGTHQHRVKFNAYDTGVGSFCEVEGLAIAPLLEKRFLILCKSPRQPELKDRLTVFAWSLTDRLPVTEPLFSLDRDTILTKVEQKKFKPSAIEWKANDATIIVVSGRNQQVVHLSKEGVFLSKQALSARLHPQSEGLALMPNGHWIIADEGQGLNPGTLTRYKSLP